MDGSIFQGVIESIFYAGLVIGVSAAALIWGAVAAHMNIKILFTCPTCKTQYEGVASKGKFKEVSNV